MSTLITPRILKGFRDLLPQSALPRQQMLDTIRSVFSLFAYLPIETPALEYTEILLGKGSDETDKQLYRFRDQGERDVALRFDLTVPLARFVAMHAATLGTPFRRYHIAPVWRAEKPQRGRYREFTQCDFDIIGCSSSTSDAEILQLVHDIFTQLKIPVRIRVNHRGLLSALLASCGGAGKEVIALRAIDKLEKLGKDVVSSELQSEAGLSSAQIDQLLSLLALSGTECPTVEILDQLQDHLASSEAGLASIERLRGIFSSLQESVSPDALVLDLSIARGLGYYTGMVFETQCLALPDIGSICSGGRYDNLTSLYSKQSYPGVGGSVGLDRTLAALEELGVLEGKAESADVLLLRLDEGIDNKLMHLASALRAAGIRTELFPEHAKLGSQIKYAQRRNIGLAILAGAREFSQNSFSLKVLESGEQHDGLDLRELIHRVTELHSGSSKGA